MKKNEKVDRQLLLDSERDYFELKKEHELITEFTGLLEIIRQLFKDGKIKNAGEKYNPVEDGIKQLHALQMLILDKNIFKSQANFYKMQYEREKKHQDRFLSLLTEKEKKSVLKKMQIGRI